MKTEYLHNALSLSKRKSAISKLVKTIKDSKIKFDAVAFTGMSGAMIAPVVADKLKKDLVLVRKNNDNCHSNLRVEMSDKKSKKVVFVDDCISSGDTVNRVIQELKSYNIECDGVFLYSEEECYRRASRINDNNIRFGIPITNIHGIVYDET